MGLPDRMFHAPCALDPDSHPSLSWLGDLRLADRQNCLDSLGFCHGERDILWLLSCPDLAHFARALIRRSIAYDFPGGVVRSAFASAFAYGSDICGNCGRPVDHWGVSHVKLGNI